MNNDLLTYYNQELNFIRRLGAEFAEQHPKVARRLKLSDKTVEDPHVSRLIEAVALLNARTRQKLDDDFPELINGLFSVIYPHYQAPIPSMSLVKFNYKAQALQSSHTIPRHVVLQTKEVQNEICYFRTAYPVTLWPIVVADAALSRQPLQQQHLAFKALPTLRLPQQQSQSSQPPLQHNSNPAGVLRLTLSYTAKDLSFAELAPQHLRFFINAPLQYATQLYEMLFNNTMAIALVCPKNDAATSIVGVATSNEEAVAAPPPLFLPLKALKAVGFGEDEGLLPYSARSFSGYRLLTEFFAFPEKFLFFDIDISDINNVNDVHHSNNPGNNCWQNFSDKAELYFYFNHIDDKLVKYLSAANFVLGCTPIVNIFEEQAEPIHLCHTHHEYQLTQNANADPQAREIYSIEQVTGSNKDGSIVEYQPFYGMKHYQPSSSLSSTSSLSSLQSPQSQPARKHYWHSSRKPADQGTHYNIQGTEVFISFSDEDFNPLADDDWMINVKVLSTNRNLPRLLPFGGNEPQLSLREYPQDFVGHIQCLVPITASHYPCLQQDMSWKLISHLSLNQLSLDSKDGDGQSVEALKEILKLYNFNDADDVKKMIDGILTLKTQRITARNPLNIGGGFWRGSEVTLEVNQDNFSSSGLFLFGTVLERFLALYSSLNSFTQLIVASKNKGELYRWSPRAGEKTLL